ncbi:sulfatase [Acidobacteria bacterium AH-259-A15]|nr:sulfatase [Acidobacteria bacterium AH-259-A15]
MRSITFLLALTLLTPIALARNVLLFTIDSCRADRFGAYGYEGGSTTHMDEWAKTGTLFENAYATSAWTAPGLVSILSGLYPPSHGINSRDHMGSPELLTLLKIFKGRGYQVPNLNFFTFAPYYKNLGLPSIESQYFGAGQGEELINWLQKNAGAGHPPFFVWYHTTMLHQPYNPDPADLPAPREELLKSPGIKAVMTGAIVPVRSVEFSSQDRSVVDQLYEAELRRLDRLFHRVLETLKDKSLREDTLIILTADHGEELLDHGFVGHASTSLQAKLYEELIRIPLIVSWPGKVPAQKRVSRSVDQTDIMPTVLRLLDFDVPSFLQGQDLFSEGTERPLFFESVIAGNQTTREREHLWVRAVRSGDHKYISTGELYNLKQDPLEERNIVHEKPALAQRLAHQLDSWLEEHTALRDKLFPTRPQTFSATKSKECPGILTPEKGQTLDYDIHTGMLLLDWTGNKNTTYLIEYDIGAGDHHVAGQYEVRGNHQLVGPLPHELWENLKAWNPFKVRVSPHSIEPCWSEWVVFHF